MNTPKNLAGLAISAAVAAVTCVSLGTPATAVVDPGDPTGTSTPRSQFELGRLIKLNLDNRPLGIAIPEIRRLLEQARSAERAAEGR
jgi:hypothetical protein